MAALVRKAVTVLAASHQHKCQPQNKVLQVILLHFMLFQKRAGFSFLTSTAEWVDALQEIGEHYRAARINLEPKAQLSQATLYCHAPIINKDITINDRNAKGFFLNVQKRNDQFRGQILHLPYAYHNASERKKYADANQACM
jgi:hypothetical protein